MLRPLTGAYPVCGVVFAIFGHLLRWGLPCRVSVCANANYGRRWSSLLEPNDPSPKPTKSIIGSSSASGCSSQPRIFSSISSRSSTLVPLPTRGLRRRRVVHSMIARNPRWGKGRREDQARHLLGLVELGEVASTGQQEQLGVGELLVEVAGHTSVQGPVGFAKNYPHRTPERPHLGLGSGSAPNGTQKVVIESEECRFRTRRRGELLIEERHELFPHFLAPDEPPPDLPPVHAAKQIEPARDEPSDVPQDGRGEQEDRLRPPRRRRGPVECVQQHERGGALRVR